MRIAGLARSSTVDYPGLLCATVFTAGCNYDCFYCHNRAIIGGEAELLEEEPLRAFLKKRAGLLDAVTVSGGEPTLQKDLPEFLRFLRQLGYKIKLDTNGSNPALVGQLLAEGLLDYCALDYKAPWDRYSEICGAGARAETVRQTAETLRSSGIAYEMRTTLFPQLTEEDLRTMAAEIHPLPRYALNPYRVPEQYKPQDLERIMAPRKSREELRLLLQAALESQPHTILMD
jgi:pyruvate formate lyase activating enzyme